MQTVAQRIFQIDIAMRQKAEHPRERKSTKPERLLDNSFEHHRDPVSSRRASAPSHRLGQIAAARRRAQISRRKNYIYYPVTYTLLMSVVNFT